MVEITPEQCRAARALLGWSQDDLADRAGVSRKTLTDFEGDNRSPRDQTVSGIQSTLEGAGVQFLPETPIMGVGVRLRKSAKRRSR